MSLYPVTAELEIAAHVEDRQRQAARSHQVAAAATSQVVASAHVSPVHRMRHLAHSIHAAALRTVSATLRARQRPGHRQSRRTGYAD